MEVLQSQLQRINQSFIVLSLEKWNSGERNCDGIQ